MTTLDSLTLLLVVQLVGEAIVRGLGAPIPGPVVGAAILAAGLAWRGIPPALHETATALLRNLALLFIPAGVGIVAQAGVLAANWLALGAALLVSTVTTLVVTVLVFRWASSRFGSDGDQA